MLAELLNLTHQTTVSKLPVAKFDTSLQNRFNIANFYITAIVGQVPLHLPKITAQWRTN